MGDAEELAEIFLNFPQGLNQTSSGQNYDMIYHDHCKIIVPSPKEGGGLITYGKEEWLSIQKALQRGLPDFENRGKIWKPLDEIDGWEDVEINGEKFRHVHVTTQMKGTHLGDGPNLLKLEGCDYKPTGKVVVWPTEWWRLRVNFKIPPKIVELKFIKVLDTASCSTGGYSMIPGVLFGIGKPLAPSNAALEYPIPSFPPLDAVDTQDPNWWSVRLEIFRQIEEKTHDEKDEIRRNIDRQVAELQQHMDYLTALETYADAPADKLRSGVLDEEEHQ